MNELPITAGNTVSVEDSARDILFEVIDRLCLGRDEAFNQITYRENSDQLSSFYYRQMPHPLFGHDSHAIDHRVGRICGYEILSHYLFHASLLRGFSLEDDFPGIIPLGDDSNQPVVLQYREGS